MFPKFNKKLKKIKYQHNDGRKKIRARDKNLGVAVEQIEAEACRRQNESPGESMHGFEKRSEGAFFWDNQVSSGFYQIEITENYACLRTSWSWYSFKDSRRVI